jgi:hypothetical protein
MNASFDRVSQDIQQIITFIQQTIGRAIEESFGYTTSPETNTFLMYLLLVLLAAAALRVFGPVHGTVKGTHTSRSATGYDFRRYG